ncbi:hypothetical protein SprV_0100307900 [Sparganum proliferum]
MARSTKVARNIRVVSDDIPRKEPTDLTFERESSQSEYSDGFKLAAVRSNYQKKENAWKRHSSSFLLDKIVGINSVYELQPTEQSTAALGVCTACEKDIEE